MNDRFSEQPTWLRPSQVAKTLDVSTGTVLAWIQSGYLSAANVAEQPAGRPRWRISQVSLDQFLQARQSSPARVQVEQTRRRPHRAPQPPRPIDDTDRRLAKNIPHEVRVKRIALAMASNQSGQGTEWRPFIPRAVEKYEARTGVKVDEGAVASLKAWWEEEDAQAAFAAAREKWNRCR